MSTLLVKGTGLKPLMRLSDPAAAWKVRGFSIFVKFDKIRSFWPFGGTHSECCGDALYRNEFRVRTSSH